MFTTLLARVRVLVDRLLAARLVENSVILAAQTFLALFPLVIIVYALIPSGAANGLVAWASAHVGLSGDSAQTVQRLSGYRGQLRANLSAASVLIVLGSATAFTRALQRVYQGAWGLPKLGLRGVWRTVAWLVGVTAYLALVGWVAHVAHAGAGLTLPVSLVFGLGLWWWTPFLLLGGRVRWRALLPGAVLTTIAQYVLGLLSVLVMPRSVRSSESTYGPIGVVFALESWLIVVAGVLVVGAALGAEMGQAKGRLGRWVRGSDDPDGWRRVTR